MGAAHDAMPWGNISDEELLKRLERSNREHLVQVIAECRGTFVQAIGEIQAALAAEGV